MNVTRTSAMDQRQHPRVSVPLVIEISHLAIGKVVTTARDVCEGGMFAVYENTPLTPGAIVRIRQLKVSEVDQHATPTVDAIIRRVEPAGFALEFTSATGAHLWNSVQRLREELAVGRDYFQVHQCTAIADVRGCVLLAKQHGRWSLPGHFLQVGQPWDEALDAYFKTNFGLRLEVTGTLGQTTELNPKAPEAAVFRVAYTASVGEQTPTLLPGSGYRESRWFGSPRALEDLDFGSEFDREIATEALAVFAKARG